MVVRTDIDNATAILTVTLTRDQVKQKVDAELKRYRQKAPIKGFRPGQIPMDRLKSMYGDAILSDVVQDLFGETLYSYLRESKMQVLGQPIPVENQEKISLSIKQLQEEYSVKYEVGFVPEFELQGLGKKETFGRYVISDLETVAKEDLEDMRKRSSQRTEVDDVIEDNDFVRTTAVELADGKIKEGGLETEISFLVSAIADEDLKAQIMTLKKGDVFQFDPRKIDNFEREEQFRRYVLGLKSDDDREIAEQFEATITNVERVSSAELTEEFFHKNFQKAENEADAIRELVEGVGDYFNRQAEVVLSRHIQERLMELNKFDLPDAFLKRWVKITDREGSLTEESIEKDYEGLALSIRWNVIKDMIMDNFVIEVTETDIKDHFKNMMRQYIRNAELPDDMFDGFAKRMMKDKKAVENAQSEIELNKIFNVLRDQVNVEDKAVTAKEFEQILKDLKNKE